MKKVLILILAISMVFSGSVFSATAITNYTDIMGEPVSNPAYTIEVYSTQYYEAGDTIVALMALSDINFTSGCSLIKFMLYYDSTKVEPIVLNNPNTMNEEMSEFLIVSPSSTQWESLCKLEAESSRYDLSFLTTSTTSAAKEDGSLVIAVPFKVKSTAKGDIAFQVPHALTACCDANLVTYKGNGGLSVTSDLTGVLGDEVANPGFTLAVTSPEYYVPGEIVNVTVTINDIKPTTGLSLINFKLHYDKTLLEPVVKNNNSTLNSEMEAFLKTAPSINQWEGLNKLVEEGSYYDISFITTIPTACAKTNGSLVITIPFRVKDTAFEDILFYIPNNETFGNDANLNTCIGNGGFTLLSMAEAAPIEPVADSDLVIDEENGFLKGVDGGTTAGSLQSQFSGDVTIINNNGYIAGNDERIGTGFVITNGVQEITVIVLGDGNGDGLADAKDYLSAKRAFLGTFNPTGAFLSALCVSGGASPTSKDYLMIKRHFLGSYNLYQ